MGKKSKAKKALKNLKKKDKKKPQKSKKEQKKTEPPKKETTNKIQQFQRWLRPLLGFIFAAGTLLLLGFLAFVLIGQTFSAAPLGRYLPADRTVASLEINTNPNHSQYLKTFDLLQDHPLYNEAALVKSLNQALDLLNDQKNDFQTQIRPWLGRQVGLALLTPEDFESLPALLFFYEFSNLQLAQSYWQNENTPQELWQEGQLYQYDENTSFIIRDKYLVFSDDSEALKLLQNLTPDQTLINDPGYQRLRNNLPANRFAFAYLDYSQITAPLLKSFALLSERGVSTASLAPITNTFQEQGFAFIADQDRFLVQSFLNINTENLSQKSYLHYPEKYQAQLLDYFPAATSFYLGGHRLPAQSEKLLEILTQGDRTSRTNLESRLSQLTKKYFGPDISWQSDLLPLFEKEYALGLENTGSTSPALKIIVKLDPTLDQEGQIAKISQEFAKMGAVYQPELIDYTLPDGTRSQEYIAKPEPIVREELEHNGYTIQRLTMGQRGWSLYYALTDEIAIFSNQYEAVLSSLDLSEEVPENRLSLKRSSYQSEFEELLLSADEITVLQLSELWSLLPPELDLQDLIPFQSAVVAKNYFQDGVVTITSLKLGL